MRDLVLQMGISIDGKVSGGPGEGAGGTTDDDVLQRHLEWLSQVTSRPDAGWTWSSARRTATGP